MYKRTNTEIEVNFCSHKKRQKKKKRKKRLIFFLYLTEFRTGKTQLSHTLCGKCATLKQGVAFFLYNNIKIQHIKASQNILSL